MSRTSSSPGRKNPSRTVIIVLVLAVIAFVIAGVRTNFRAQVGGGSGEDVSSSPTSSAVSEPYRECSSRGTIFEGMRNLDRVQQLFVSTMSDIVEERQLFLTDTTRWTCGDDTEPPMPRLQAVASAMPAWQYRKSNFFSGLFNFGYSKVLRPVTFESFPSIVGELLREYECTVSELQSQAHYIVASNDDYVPGTEFCCTTNGCEPTTDASTRCIGEITEHPQCNSECKLPDLSQEKIANQPSAFFSRAIPERNRARLAVERTLSVLRSYEIEHHTLWQLLCTERVSLDLLNSTALLSEAASCLPKIWDAATSLHDTK